MCDQIRSIDKSRLVKRIGELSQIWKLDDAQKITLDLD
jgi:mRNA-degrading endonuclease toxin of MazEF toxin-antitoxin module